MSSPGGKSSPATKIVYEGYHWRLSTVGTRAATAAAATASAYPLGAITVGPEVYNVVLQPAAPRTMGNAASDAGAATAASETRR